jgi:hypothetical protein
MRNRKTRRNRVSDKATICIPARGHAANPDAGNLRFKMRYFT